MSANADADADRRPRSAADGMAGAAGPDRAARGAPGATPSGAPADRGPRAAEWDATTYHRVATPHVAWGRRVLDRLPLRGDETVADLGCGTGRPTADLLARLPRGHVVAVDRSAAMLAEARAHLRPLADHRVLFLRADLGALPLRGPLDAVFSAAAFHWVPDHARLFATIFVALAPGGRLVAQCGGGPNIATVRERVAALAATPRFAPALGGWSGPWLFAGPDETADRLRAAGFAAIETGLEPSPTTLPDAAAYRSYLETVVLGVHLARIPAEADRAALLDALTAHAADDDPPFALDYWRLNLRARRP